MDKEGQKPDSNGEQEILGVVVGVLGPDDHRVEADERLDDGQYDQQCCQDFQVFLPRVQVENPEKSIDKFTIKKLSDHFWSPLG